MTIQIDLEEFVSDYLRIFWENDEPIPPRQRLAKEIADQYLDATEQNYDSAETEALISQILYYLP